MKKCAGDINQLVSVILTTYNRADLILGTLNSILLQTYRPIELIVVDDGSTDETYDLICEWKDNLPKDDTFFFKYIFQRNGGAPSARNLGFLESKGEFIQWWDSDDYMYPSKLEKQIIALRKTYDLWAACFMENGFSGNTLTKQLTASKNVILGALCTPSVVYKRELINEVGLWNTELKVMQDTEFCFRILCKEPTGVWIEEKLGSINIDGPGIMRKPAKEKAKHVAYTINAIEHYAKINEKYDAELKKNFGKIFFYYYRQLSSINCPDSENFFYLAKIRCTGRSARLLKIFRIIDKLKLAHYIPARLL